MCVIFILYFLKNIVPKHRKGVHVMTTTGKFDKKIAETDGMGLHGFAVSCLSLDNKFPRRADDVLAELTKLDADP